MKKYTVVGVILSVLCVATLVGLIYMKRDSASQLSLNELGDLFGGFVAPIALIWLVLGYLQQGEELRLNTEALKSQQVELQKQVKEMTVLSNNADRQAAAAEAMVKSANMRELRDLNRR